MKQSSKHQESWSEKAIGYFAVICIGVIAALSTGCTNRFGGSNLYNAPVVNPASWNTPVTANANGFATSAYNCPFTANVMPDYDYNDNGTDQYTVCPSNLGNISDIWVKGNPQGSSEFCVIPASWDDAQDIFAIPNSATGLPWYKCFGVQSGGVDVSFPGLTFNYVYIVESENLAPMMECLISGNSITCPVYSEGKFR